MIATAGSLAVAFVVSIVWLSYPSRSPRFEPVVQILGLLAGISGIAAERWAATREKRDQAVRAIREELEENARLLNSAPFAERRSPQSRRGVYPRLSLSAVNAAFSSSVLFPLQDESLSRLLHEWRHEVELFNQQLSVAEILAFTIGSDDVLQELDDGLHQANGPLEVLERQLDELMPHLRE
jgi:hypothetical protein